MNISQLKEEFMNHFECPDSQEPYESHEGGFYNSKLIDTEDAVAEVFTDLSESELKLLIDELNTISTGWSRKE